MRFVKIMKTGRAAIPTRQMAVEDSIGTELYSTVVYRGEFVTKDHLVLGINCPSLINTKGR